MTSFGTEKHCIEIFPQTGLSSCIYFTWILCYLPLLVAVSQEANCSPSSCVVPFFHAACVIKRIQREGSDSTVSQASVTVSTPVCRWGIHTRQINPYALSAAHSAHVKSSTPCRDWGDISERQTERQTLWGTITLRNNIRKWKLELMTGVWETGERREDKPGRLMKGKLRDTNKAANETDASTCCDLFLFI